MSLRASDARPVLSSLLALIGGLLLLGVASADVLHLKNGRKIRGEVNAEESDETILVLDLPGGGRTQIPRSQIKRIVREGKEDYRLRQGRAYSRNGDHDGAVAILAEARRLHSESKPIAEALAVALIRRGRFLLERGQAEAAQADFDAARAVDDGAAVSGIDFDAVDRAVRTLTGKITRARKLAAGGQVDAAIALYEEVRAQDAGSLRRVGEPLSQLYASRADARIRALVARSGALDPKTCAVISEDYDRALEINADLLDRVGPRWALVKVLLGFYRRAVPAEDLQTAADLSLGEALTGCARALRFEALGKFEEAEKIWREVGGAKAPDPRRASVALAVGEVPLDSDTAAYKGAKNEDKWSFINSRHFRIRHRNRAAAQAVSKTAEYHYERIFPGVTKSTDCLSGGRVQITLYPTRQDYIKDGNPSNTEGVTRTRSSAPGLFSIEIRVFQTNRQLLTSTVPHELVHAILPMILLHNKLPPWYHEGLATYHESELKKAYYRRVVRDAARRRSLIPAKVFFSLGSYPTADEVGVYYGEASLVIAELARRGGLRKLLDLGRDLQSLPAEEALKRRYALRDLAVFDQVFAGAR